MVDVVRRLSLMVVVVVGVNFARRVAMLFGTSDERIGCKLLVYSSFHCDYYYYYYCFFFCMC